MREDMAQVVIERPRRGSRWLSYHQVRPVSIARFDVERFGDLPQTQGMRQRHIMRKGFSDLLGPLRKYVTRQVGRPWDKVYSEICKRISPDSTVQLHILGHLDDIIVTKATLTPDGRIRRIDRFARWRRAFLDECPGQVYVHPITGIVRRTPETTRIRKGALSIDEPAIKVVGVERELWLRDGIWY